MPKSTSLNFNEQSQLATELRCYLQADVAKINLPKLKLLQKDYDVHYAAWQYSYKLPLGTLDVLALILYVPATLTSAAIKLVRLAAIRSVLNYQQRQSAPSADKSIDFGHYSVLTVDIQFKDASFDIKGIDGCSHNKSKRQDTIKRLTHDFDVRYFMEDIVLDVEENKQVLQVLSWEDWQQVLQKVQTPYELQQFLTYHLEHLTHSIVNHAPSFDSIKMLLTSFLNSETLYSQAIKVDNALIKNAMQEKPNAALITMSLAQQSKNPTAEMYQQHLSQAAVLWSQLSTQMIDMMSKNYDADGQQLSEEPIIEKQIIEQKIIEQPFTHWQQQLLAESLFSRHELVRTLYRHPKQNPALLQSGYVVHQHSYSSLGRHYVMIFYGQEEGAIQSRDTIQPNMQKIALEVATRIPLGELHHIIVLGIAFIVDNEDTYMDIDLWIQPVNAMTQKERQLTKYIQRLKHQNAEKKQANHPREGQANTKPETHSALKTTRNKQANGLPSVHLNVSIPAQKNKS